MPFWASGRWRRKPHTRGYSTIVENAWQVYQGDTTRSVSQRLRRFREWGVPLTHCPLNTKLLKRCEKKTGFLPAYECPQCVRTSHMSDRLMKGMDGHVCVCQTVFSWDIDFGGIWDPSVLSAFERSTVYLSSHSRDSTHRDAFSVY